jgi:hypothetical protein
MAALTETLNIALRLRAQKEVVFCPRLEPLMKFNLRRKKHG